MKKQRDIIVINYEQGDGLPVGKDVFYLCLNCRIIIPSDPEHYVACKCKNIIIDPESARGGAYDESQLVVLKIE